MTAMLQSSDDSRKFMQENWGYETSRRPTVKLTPVLRKKSVLHDFLASEGMTLLIGEDGNYYTSQEKSGPYGDYAWTDWTEYGRFVSPGSVRAHLSE